MTMRAVVVLALVALAFLGPGPAAALSAEGPGGAFVPDANADRSTVPDRFKWGLEPLFASDEAFAHGLAEAAGARKRLAAFEGRLSDPQALRECLDLYFEARLLTNRLTLYGNLRRVTDVTSTPAQALHTRGLQALDELMAAAAFVRREVLALPDATLEAALSGDQALARYRPYLDELRRRDSRVLGAEAERVLSLAGDNLWAEIDLNEIPSDHEKTHAAILASLPLPRIRDANGKEVQLTLSNYEVHRSSPDRRVRQEAVGALLGTLRSQEQALAAALAGQARLDVFMARARGYDTALAAYLDKDQIDPAVYHTLISAVRENLKPLRDYVALRRKVMGLEDLRLHDLYTPLVAGASPRFPFAEAQRLLPEALLPLGPDYVSALRQGLDPENGWIDLYPNRNKEAGAFSSSVYRVHPFVKMNYQDGYEDLSTLAHELGHALHSVRASAAQPYPTSGYSSFVAEIASTVNEKLLSDHVLARAGSDAERLYLLNRLLESLRTTVYRQTLFAEFDLAVHTAVEQGTPVTAEWLDHTYRGLVADYYGPGFALGEDDEVEWAYIPHFFYKYYVYSYATGLSAAVVLAEGLRSGDPARRGAYLGMLDAGNSRPPLELLRAAGVDLTRPDAVRAVAALMSRTIAEIEVILARQQRR